MESLKYEISSKIRSLDWGDPGSKNHMSADRQIACTFFNQGSGKKEGKTPQGRHPRCDLCHGQKE